MSNTKQNTEHQATGSSTTKRENPLSPDEISSLFSLAQELSIVSAEESLQVLDELFESIIASIQCDIREYRVQVTSFYYAARKFFESMKRWRQEKELPMEARANGLFTIFFEFYDNDHFDAFPSIVGVLLEEFFMSSQLIYVCHSQAYRETIVVWCRSFTTFLIKYPTWRNNYYVARRSVATQNS